MFGGRFFPWQRTYNDEAICHVATRLPQFFLNNIMCPMIDRFFHLSSSLRQFHYHHYFTTLTGYWPSNVRVCGFWFLPMEWQFSCKECSEISVLVSSRNLQRKDELCSAHIDLHTFLKNVSMPPVFVGLSSVGRQVLYLCICFVLNFF